MRPATPRIERRWRASAQVTPGLRSHNTCAQRNRPQWSNVTPSYGRQRGTQFALGRSRPIHGSRTLSDLTEQEAKKVEEEERLNADVIYEVIRRQGIKELRRPVSALMWSGLAAGLAMSLSAIAEGVLRSHLPDAPWRPLLTRLGYPVGFLVVILGAQQLYTENTLMPVVPVLAHKVAGTLRRMLQLWAVVFLANIVGAAIMAFVMARTNLLEAEVRSALSAIANEAMSPGPV